MMRPARTLLTGLALSTLLASAALASGEPDPGEASPAPAAVAEPVSGNSEAVSATDAAAAPVAETSNSAEQAEDTADPAGPSAASGQQTGSDVTARHDADEAGSSQTADVQPAASGAASEAEPDASIEPATAAASEPEKPVVEQDGSTVSTASTTTADPVAGEAAEEQPEQATAGQEPAAQASDSLAITDPGVDDQAEPEPEQASTPDAPTEPQSPASAEADPTNEAPETAPAAAAAQSGQPEQSSDTASAEQTIEVSQFEPELLRLISEAQDLSDAEREALTEFYKGRGDDFLWVADGTFTPRAEAAMAEIRRADDWGLEASAFELPDAVESSEPADVAAAELKLSLAVLKYAKHARGGRMDPRQLSNYIDREPPLLPPAEVLAGIAAADAADGYLRGLHPQHPQFEKLRQAWLDLRNGKLPAEDAEEDVTSKSRAKRKSRETNSAESKMRKLLYNMEQWRWMPEDLGQFYVWANIPEFTLRVVKDGKTVFTERLVVGKADTQTPIFSDEMETIVFHPFWGVPNSIKVKEILPGLIRGTNVLARNDLRIQYRGRDIDPWSVDWTRTDIRNFHVYQPPGGKNVLGVVKFLFPNKHAVYMHDTPTKNLFSASQRTFSHGCMRVRNPLKFAEVLLAYDKGWSEGRVLSLVRNGPRNNHVNVESKIPVHITYFTAWVDEDGKVRTWPDVYGHEKRIQMGLEGKAHLIAKTKEDLGAVQAEVVGRLAETRPTWSSPSYSSSRQPDWARRAFGH
jgi:murein L,D-transpeptidase YcbB/YkuD